MSRTTDLKRCLAAHPTVTPRIVAQFCYGSDDEEAYHKAIVALGKACKAGVAQRVCAGVYQRAGNWRLPEPIETIIKAIEMISRGSAAQDVLPILESCIKVNR